jgi:hypothetical protein
MPVTFMPHRVIEGLEARFLQAEARYLQAEARYLQARARLLQAEARPYLRLR